MKRTFKTLIALCLCLCMVLGMVPAAFASISSIAYPDLLYTVEGDVAYVTGVEWIWEYLGDADPPITYNVNVSEAYQGCPVVGIKDGALDLYYRNLELNLYIPDSVTSVGSGAITGDSVKTVTFQGAAPVFTEDAFDGANMTVHCGHADMGWSNPVKQNYGGSSVTWRETIHAYNTKTVTKASTCTEAGSYIGTCNCGVGAVFSMNKLPHEPVDGVCTVCKQDVRFAYTVNGTECTINALPIGEGVLEIPETLNGYTVTKINGFLKNVEGYTKVVIPDTVVKIDMCAFQSSTTLQTVIIGSGVTEIGLNAFSGCSALSCVTFLGDAPKINARSFADVTAVVRYPADNETYTDSVKANYGGTLTWEIGCQHVYEESVITEATCGKAGIKNLTCTLCGEVKTEAIPQTEHTIVGMHYSYETCSKTEYTCKICGYVESAEYSEGEHTWISSIRPNTEPTCTQNGYTYKECLHCGKPLDTVIPATGHNYTKRRFTDTYTWYEYTCTECGDFYMEYADGHDWQSTPPWNAHKDPTCTDDGYDSLYCEHCNTVWSKPIYALGHSYVGGICTNCGEGKSIYEPTIVLKYPTVTFKDIILMNIYFQAYNLDNVQEMGLVTYKQDMAQYSIDNADAVISGYQWSEPDGLYYATTNGIAAKELGDTLYFAVYAKLNNGTYTYSKLVFYNPETYAYTQLASGSDNMKALMVAMLNYGAEAQIYFSYKTDALVNADLTDEQTAMVEDYSSDMVSAVVQPDKLSGFTESGNIASRSRTVSFEGAFGVNYYCSFATVPIGDVTMYYWDSRTYDSADALTVDNATKVIPMENTGDGIYCGRISGIAAKDLDKTFYVAFAYSDGIDHATDLQSYSIGSYCRSSAAKNNAISALAAATAVYGYYANRLFNK